MKMKMKYCIHNLPIFTDNDGNDISTCAICNPPETFDNRKRLSGYVTNITNFCTEETVELLKKQKVSIFFQVPPWAETEFADDYYDSTGVLVNFSETGIYQVNAKTKEDKRWYSAYVEFEPKENLLFSKEYRDRFKFSENSKRVKIHCIHFAGFLLSHGFKAGLNEPKE
jgi:hypothetical protein